MEKSVEDLYGKMFVKTDNNNLPFECRMMMKQILLVVVH